MMGMQSGQIQMVILDIASIIPKNHLLRQIKDHVNFDFIYEKAAPYYSNIGRKSIAPVILIKMLLIGYLYGIKSERRLEEEVSLKLAYRWFCGIELMDRVPDHSTFSQNRKRRFQDAGIFREIFNEIVLKCIELGIVGPMSILPVVREWQERPLEDVYAVVFMDAIHYHVRSEGRIVKRAVYIALGIDMNGKKDVLGMYVGENESAKFWLSIMNGLKNRGVEDILIACVDGLTGFPQAIEAVYPQTEIQQCIIHQIRNSTKFVSYKDIKRLMADLKRVYAAPTEETALNELEAFRDKWDPKYPKIYRSWHEKWATLSTYFKYPEAVRRLIYTTNAIEGFNRQLRKVTKSRTVFPTDDSLLKMLYLAMMDITKKWSGHRQDWGQIHSQLEIYFEERLAGRNL